ncbi:ABC transporter substrate-binding protein [Desulfosporosinus sp. OT]|uniref:ABC transporter substrate-binding protein n=1 Tax=Desulfosporosinus sp. OT TaxID=913865 RepID=UPI000223ADF7|nr:ABC transporter substrate-binding protein [Desulfosporosinus sp. OT]EGW37551.1 extracellular substrate-binding protein [Desulfosporosinus sp. OT]
MTIDSDSLISELLRQYPETLEVFASNGFEDLVDKDILRQIGPFIRLKTMLQTRHINPAIFIKLLEERINTFYSLKYSLESCRERTTDKLNLLALLPCPLKLPLQQAFDKYLAKEFDLGNDGLDYLIEGNANNQLSYYPYVDQFEDLEDIPDVIITPGLNNFFHQRFIQRFIDKGFFLDAANYQPHNRYLNSGIKDPGGNYTILAMNVLVMVIDHSQIGSTDFPKKWEDILNPEFEKRVAMRGQNDFFCETVLLAIYKTYGMEAIKRLGRSVKYGWHPAQMAKAAGSGNKGAPAVSIMPYFFTKTIKHKENITIVWPEDGAIISPVTMLVKAEKAQKLEKIANFFTSREIGNICAGACFPSLHPEVKDSIPESVAFNWLEWDFIKSRDIGELQTELNAEFLVSFNQ